MVSMLATYWGVQYCNIDSVPRQIRLATRPRARPSKRRDFFASVVWCEHNIGCVYTQSKRDASGAESVDAPRPYKTNITT